MCECSPSLNLNEFELDMLLERIENLEKAVRALASDPGNPRTAAAQAIRFVGPLEFLTSEQ